MMRYRRNAGAGFTLIELLVVIAIIAILSLLLLPIINKAKETSRKTKARREISHLEAALRAYIDEYKKPHGNIVNYGSWPVLDTDVEGTIDGIQVENTVVEMLAGENVDNSNPQRIPFYEASSISTNGDGAFVDPWGQPYKYMFDYNFDGVVTVNFTSFDGVTNLHQLVAVWSRGMDGSDALSTGGWDDDVRNW